MSEFDPFRPSYYDEDEYDLDKFITDYSDVLNAHNLVAPSTKEERLPLEDPYKDSPKIPLGLTDKELWGPDGAPKEMFKSMNRADLAGMIRAGNPGRYNNFHDEDLIRIAKQGGMNTDSLLFGENINKRVRINKGLESFWDNTVKNISPALKAAWWEMGDQIRSAGVWAGISDPTNKFKNYKSDADKIIAANNKAYEEKIKNDPDLRAWLRWGENNPLDWDNWYDPNKLTDITFSAAPSYGVSIALSTLTAIGTKNPYAAGAVMFGTTFSMEHGAGYAGSINELMQDVNVSREDYEGDVSDYQTSLRGQLDTGVAPDGYGVDYIKDSEMNPNRWKKMSAVDKRDYINSRTDNFTKEVYNIQGDRYTRKGLTATEAGNAAIATSLAYSFVSSSIELIPGMAAVNKLSKGTIKTINGIKSFNKSGRLAKIINKIPGRKWDLFGADNWSWMKIATVEGLEEFSQYGAEVLSHTTVPYKDPDTGGWHYGISRQNFAEKWDWSEAMESFLGGFLLPGGIGLSSTFMKKTGQYTGINSRFDNYFKLKRKGENNSWHVSKNKDGSFGLSFHNKNDDGKWETTQMQEEDMADWVPHNFAKFSDAYGVAKVLNETNLSTLRQMDWGAFGKYHNASYKISTDAAGDDIMTWTNSAGEVFAENNLSKQKNDDGSIGLSKKKAIKYAKGAIKHASDLYVYLEGDVTLEKSGWVQIEGNDDGGSFVKWEAPYAEGPQILTDTKGQPILDDKGMPQFGGPGQGPRTTAVVEAGETQMKASIAAVKAGKSFKPVSKKDAGESIEEPLIDTEAPIPAVVPVTTSTSLKARLFTGGAVSENEQDDATEISKSGTLTKYSDMKELLNEYDTVEDFERDTGVKFDTYVSEMSQSFPDETPITTDDFVKQEQKKIQKTKDFEDEQTKTPPKKKVPSKPKGYAGYSSDELTKALGEAEESLKGATTRASKGMSNLKIKNIKKEIESRKEEEPKIQKRIVRGYKTNKQLEEERDEAIKDLLVVEGKGLDSSEANARIKLAESELELNKLREEQNRIHRTHMIAEGQDAPMSDLNKIISELESVTKEIDKLELKIDEDELSYSIAFGGRYDGPRFGNESIFKRTPKIKSKGEATVEEVSNILDKLSKKFTMLGDDKINVVEFDASNVEHATYAINNNVDVGVDAGWYDPRTNTVYVDVKVAAKEALDTPFHEFMHPFITQLRKSNPKLFKSLYDELIAEDNAFGQQIFKDVKEDYGELYEKDFERFMEEVIVTAIGLGAEKSYTKKVREDKGFKAWLKRVYQWIKEFIFGETAATNVYVRPWELNENTTIKQLAEMLADLEGTYSFELLDTKIQDDVLYEIRDQAGLGDSMISIEDLGENLLNDPNFNITSIDNLEGQAWVQAHTALIGEIGDLFGINIANIFDANKVIRKIYLTTGKKDINKTVSIMVDKFLDDFDKIINTKFKMTKKKYKPTKKTKAKIKHTIKSLSSQFKKDISILDFTPSPEIPSEVWGASGLLLKEKMIEKFESKYIQKKFEDIGKKVHDYIEKVRFNYTFNKIISQKSGKLSLNQLADISHKGMNTKKSEKTIIETEFIPFLRKNFKEEKSLDAEIIQEQYRMFMEHNYGIHKYVGSGYQHALFHDKFYSSPFQDGSLDVENVKTHRFIFSDRGFQMKGHTFTLGENAKLEGMPGVGGTTWYAADLVTNDDGTIDITGFEFQSDFLDHIRKVSKYTNNFSEKIITLKSKDITDPYYHHVNTLVNTIIHGFISQQKFQGTDWIPSIIQNFDTRIFLGLLFNEIAPLLGSEISNNEIELLMNTINDFQKGNITQDRAVYPWKGTDSPLADYGLIPEIVNNLTNAVGGINNEFRDKFIKSVHDDKFVIVPMSIISQFSNKNITKKFLQAFETKLHSFKDRARNIERIISEDYAFKTVGTIFHILKKGSNENRLALKSVFQEIADVQKADKIGIPTHSDRANIGASLLRIPGLIKALQETANISQLGMKSFDVSTLVGKLSAFFGDSGEYGPDTQIKPTEDGQVFPLGTFINWVLSPDIANTADQPFVAPKQRKQGLILADGSLNPEYLKFTKTGYEGATIFTEEQERLERLVDTQGADLHPDEWETLERTNWVSPWLGSLNQIIYHYYKGRNQFINKRRAEKQTYEHFTGTFVIPIMGMLHKLNPAKFRYTDIETELTAMESGDKITRIFDSAMNYDYIENNLDEKSFDKFKEFIFKLNIRRDKSITANVYRHFHYSLEMLRKVGVEPGLIETKKAEDIEIAYNEENWMKLFKLDKEDIALNKKWDNLHDSNFDKMIRFWMIDSLKYNGKSYLMLAANHTLLGNGGGAPIYYSPGEAAVQTLKNSTTALSMFSKDMERGKITKKDIEKHNLNDFEIEYLLLGRQLPVMYELTDPVKIISFMEKLYEGERVVGKENFSKKYRINRNIDGSFIIPDGAINKLYEDFLNVSIAAQKKLFNWYRDKTEEALPTTKIGPFYTALMKIKKKENIELSYEIPAKGTRIMLRVHTEDVKSESLTPLFMRKIKKSQMELFEPVTEEEVLDKVDTYIKDYHTTYVMDSNTMFKNILEDFKNVALARYGIKIVDAELFKSSMLKQLTEYPDLKKNFIEWHDDYFASDKHVAANKKLGSSNEQYGIEDNISDDYNYSLTEIFENFKELGRFDDVMSGKNSNENYQNILDFAWLRELGINITKPNYDLLLKRARNSKTFIEFIQGKKEGDFGIKVIVGRTRFNTSERQKFKKFWNRVRSNISVNNKNAARKNWWVVKTVQKWGEAQSIGPVVRKGVDNVIKRRSNPQWDKQTLFERNEPHHPYIFEWISKSDVFSKKNLTDEQIIKGQRNQASESYDYFRPDELSQLNKRFNKEDRTIAFVRGDSKRIAVVKVHQKYVELAKNKDTLKAYWDRQQQDGFIPDTEEGNQMIKELMSGNAYENAEAIARHAAYKIVWPMYKFHSAPKFMKRIVLPFAPGTFADELKDFKTMFYDPTRATVVHEDGLEIPLYKHIPEVGNKYIGDGGDFVSQSLLSDYRNANGLRSEVIEFKTAIYQKDGMNTIMFKHNSFLVDKNIKIYEDYGKPTQRLIAYSDGHSIKNAEGEDIGMLSTKDEVKVFDGYNSEEIVTIKGSNVVTPFYNEEKSNKATHPMQMYNYYDDADSIFDLWNPSDGVLTLSIQRSMAKLFNMGIDKQNTSEKKIQNFLEEIIGTEVEGFLPAVLEHAKLGAGFHPVISNALDKLVQTRIINPALNLKGRPGAKLVIRPNISLKLEENEISIPMHALGPVLSKIASSLNVPRKDLTINMVNDWLENNSQKVLLYRTPIASIRGAGVYKIAKVHGNMNVILMNEKNIFFDLEADQDADKVQIEYLNDETLDKMEEYFKSVPFKRTPLNKFVPDNYEGTFSTNTNKQLFELIGALVAGQNGLGEIAKAASIYGILNSWFKSMTINGRKVILTPKDYTMTWPTYYDGEQQWQGSFPEMLSILLQASADNAEFMLLGKWKYKRDNLYRMMFKYEDTMENIDDEDVKLVLAMMPTLKMPSNIRRGNDYVNGKYFASHTFRASQTYSDFVSDRFGYFKAILADDSKQYITSTLDALEVTDNLHPLEIVAMMPDGMRSINEYRNHIMTSSEFPLTVSDTMHKNSHRDAVNAVMDSVAVEKVVNEAINRDGKSELSNAEKKKYIAEQYKIGTSYALSMKNDFILVVNKHQSPNYSSMDREENMIKFKEHHDRKFKELSELAKVHATLRFMEGFITFSESFETKRGKTLKVLPPVSMSKKEYSLLDWRVIKDYYKAYNRSIKEKRDTKKALASSRFKNSYNETIRGICGRL